ncbi:hypothetical protein [Paragemmobacter straminiformis]|nr:hypothetical protein [Gemmobacter straminiformis]
MQSIRECFEVYARMSSSEVLEAVCGLILLTVAVFVTLGLGGGV